MCKRLSGNIIAIVYNILPLIVCVSIHSNSPADNTKLKCKFSMLYLPVRTHANNTPINLSSPKTIHIYSIKYFNISKSFIIVELILFHSTILYVLRS